MSLHPHLADIKKYFLELQRTICEVISKEDPSRPFLVDEWEMPEKKGISCILEDAAVIERGGVNFSHVQGAKLPHDPHSRFRAFSGGPYEALGISLVLHPRNPYCPTTHMNLRSFFAKHPDREDRVWWFGGGFDLTPYYGFDEDCIHWHQTAHDVCEGFSNGLYLELKCECDKYFYLPNRQEARGIGGIFFDGLENPHFERNLFFIQSVGESFIKAYQPILAKRKNHPYGERERQFQLYRRGRYVEFNLLHDRGTLFGLQSQGRIESIFMSLPPLVSWKYDYHPEPGSPEAELYEKYLVPKDWLNLTKLQKCG